MSSMVGVGAVTCIGGGGIHKGASADVVDAIATV